MNKILALIVAAALVVGVVPMASASISYDADGRVVYGQNYTGPGLGWEDLTLIGTAAYPLVLMTTMTAGATSTALMAITPASFIVWGALRTAKYRPASAQSASAEPDLVPGSVAELLR